MAAKPSRAAGAGVSSETTMPVANESGIVTSAGFLSGNQAVACASTSIWMAGDT